MHHLTDRITHTTAFATPAERELAQWVDALPQSYISLLTKKERDVAPW